MQGKTLAYRSYVGRVVAGRYGRQRTFPHWWRERARVAERLVATHGRAETPQEETAS